MTTAREFATAFCEVDLSVCQFMQTVIVYNCIAIVIINKCCL